MTFPSGAPGGFPAQGPQQPLQGPGYGPPRPGIKLGLPQIGHLVVAGLGVLIFFFAFIKFYDGEGDGNNFYGTGNGWIPALLFVGGVLSLKAILPGEDKKPGLVPPVTIFAITWAFLFAVFNLGDQSPDLAVGGILVMILSILQMLAAIAVYLLDAGIIKMPQPNPYAHQQQGGFPQTGTFQQAPPSAAFPQQQPPQQQPPQQPGQQTTFAPQQGQFGQQQPGTPPGGYPPQG